MITVQSSGVQHASPSYGNRKLRERTGWIEMVEWGRSVSGGEKKPKVPGDNWGKEGGATAQHTEYRGQVAIRAGNHQRR